MRRGVAQITTQAERIGLGCLLCPSERKDRPSWPAGAKNPGRTAKVASTGPDRGPAPGPRHEQHLYPQGYSGPGNPEVSERNSNKDSVEKDAEEEISKSRKGSANRNPRPQMLMRPPKPPQFRGFDGCLPQIKKRTKATYPPNLSSNHLGETRYELRAICPLICSVIIPFPQRAPRPTRPRAAPRRLR